jgi:hypothetical protein
MARQRYQNVKLTRVLAMIVVALGLAGVPSSPAATLATGGKPQMSIVLAEGAIPAERTASEELAGYLSKVTGGEFSVVGESAAVPLRRAYSSCPKRRTEFGNLEFRTRSPVSPSGWNCPTRR